jgi:hypothetical protein
MTADDHLLQDKVCLVKVENQIQLTHIPEILIKYLDKVMNDIEDNQFIVFLLYASSEVQTGVALEYDLVVAPFQKVGQPATPPDDHATYLRTTRGYKQSHLRKWYG